MLIAALPSRSPRIPPALALMFLSPFVAEVLPGATRFSALFVFPIEMCVWGGGALLIRDAVRRWRLGWLNMLILAVALAVAEEFIIQQTSLAPLVVQIKGQVYARALGVNYVYMLWALVYESVFVVFLPVYLAELIYPNRRDDLWVSRNGLIAVIVFFLIGSGLAWYSWTHIARPNVFHVPVYNPPLEAMLMAATVCCGLIFIALSPFRDKLPRDSRLLKSPPPWLLGTIGFVWAVLWFGLMLLAFGIAPSFSPLLAVSTALLLTTAILLVVPRWTFDPRFQSKHQLALIVGTILGTMVTGYLRFIDGARTDLYFKIVVDVVAVVLMMALGLKIHRRSTGAT